MITVAPQVNQANKSLKLDLENLTDDQKALEIKDLDLYYGEKQALSKVNMNIPKGQVTAFIGTVSSVDYVGAGTLLNIGEIAESSELQANGITVTLSGITDPLLAKARDEDYQGRELTVKLGAMDAANAVITNPITVFSGFMDTMIINDSAETATIQVTVENRLIEFERTRIRRYTAEDQKIDFPTDKGLEFVAEMAEKEIVWGRANVGSGIGAGDGEAAPSQPEILP